MSNTEARRRNFIVIWLIITSYIAIDNMNIVIQLNNKLSAVNSAQNKYSKLKLAQNNAVFDILTHIQGFEKYI